MFRTRILGLFRLFRFELPFNAGVCVILGELLALGKLPNTTEIVLGFLSIFFISFEYPAACCGDGIFP